MKRSKLIKSASMFSKLSAGCLFASTAFAFVTPDTMPGIQLKSSTIQAHTYVPAQSFFSNDGVSREYDRQSNAIRYLSGSKIFGVMINDQNAASFERAALNAIASHQKVFGIDSSEAVLNRKATLVSGDDASVSFHVYRSGVRISDAGITFHFKKGSLILVKSETYSEAAVEASSQPDSASIAASAVGSATAISRGSLYRVKTSDAGYSLVKVDEYLTSNGKDAFVVQVDTTNGQVFELRTKNFHLTGSAATKAYPRYFGDAISLSKLPFIKLANATGAASELGIFSSTDASTAPSLNGFAGTYIAVKNEAGDDFKATATKVDGKWSLEAEIAPGAENVWENPEMAQAMVYLNVNKIIGIAKKYINPAWFDKALVANVNNSEHCNAFWDGDTLNFFSGGEHSGKTCANTGIISDVAFHEWGHGLDDNTGGIDDSGMSEGYGDALATFITDDPRIGVEFMPIEHKPVRDVSVVKVFPRDVSFDPHKTGLIIAGAWYDLGVALKAKLGADKAKDLMGKFLFKGIYQFAKMSDVYKATVALDDDNANLADGTPNLCVINKVFKAHGLATADASCAKKKGI